MCLEAVIGTIQVRGGNIKCRDYDWEKENRYILCLRWFRQLQRKDGGYIGQKMLKMK